VTVTTQTDIFFTRLSRLDPLEVTVERQVLADVLTVSNDGTPILQLFFHHPEDASGEVGIGEFVDRFVEALQQVRHHAIARAADAGAERVHALIAR